MQFIPLVGRVLFSAIFIMFGLGHFTQTALMTEMVPDFLPAKGLVVIVTGTMIVVGGLMVLLGYRAKVGGVLLATFLIPVALLVHGPGFAAGEVSETGLFMRDLALAGGALLISHFGSGPKSLDDRLGEDDAYGV